MLSADGRFVICYNGEIYNFRHIRQILEGLGHEFRGRSDTEVLLAEVPAGRMKSHYLALGDWFAGVCLLFCLVAVVVGHKSEEKPSKTARTH